MSFLSLLLFTTFLSTLTLLTYAVYWRLTYTLSPTRPKPIRHGRRNPREPTHLLIVLGSGGHTAEMLAMLSRAVDSPAPAQLDWRDFSHRTWVVGEGDDISALRAREFEERASELTGQETLMRGNVRAATDLGPGTWEIRTVPRARKVHQSGMSSVGSVVKSFVACWGVLTKDVFPADVSAMGHIPSGTRGRDFPDLILVNGPATGTVMVVASVALRFFDIRGAATRFRMRTIYVESWARVKSMSLSGRILSRVVDRCLVQWPALDARKTGAGRAEYLGTFV